MLLQLVSHKSQFGDLVLIVQKWYMIFSACQRQQQCNSVEIITLLTISVIDSGPRGPTRAPCWIWYLQVHHFLYDPLRGMPAF